MSGADRLREAAALLRKRAEAATPGPWSYFGAVRGPEQVMVADADPRDRAYIAAMHPSVGHALGGWLHNAADIWGGLDPGEADEAIDRMMLCAIAVADAVLGGEDR